MRRREGWIGNSWVVDIISSLVESDGCRYEFLIAVSYFKRRTSNVQFRSLESFGVRCSKFDVSAVLTSNGSTQTPSNLIVPRECLPAPERGRRRCASTASSFLSARARLRAEGATGSPETAFPRASRSIEKGCP